MCVAFTNILMALSVGPSGRRRAAHLVHDLVVPVVEGVVLADAVLTQACGARHDVVALPLACGGSCAIIGAIWIDF